MTLALVHVNFAVVPCIAWLTATPIPVDARSGARTMVLAWLAQTLVDILVARAATPAQCTYALDKTAGVTRRLWRFLPTVVALVLMRKPVGALLSAPVIV